MPRIGDKPQRAGGNRRVMPAVLALALAAGAVAAGSLDEARRLHGAGRFDDALAAYREVAADPAATAADVAVALNNSCVLHQGRGEYRLAVEECRRALALRTEAGDDRGAGRTFNNLGLALQSLGSYDEAAASFNRALDINLRRGDLAAAAINRANLGGLATLTGDYDAAIAHHLAVAKLADAHLEEPWAREQAAIARVNRGVVLEKLGQYREALDLYRQVLGEGGLSDRRRAQVLVNAGVAYRNLGDPRAAIARFENAAEVFRAAGDLSGLSNALLNRGLALHLNLGRLAEAEDALREALALARRSGDRPEEIQDLFYLGRLLLDAGRAVAAREAFAECLALAETSGSPEGRWSALDGLGRVALTEGDLRGAWASIDRALTEIETVRLSVAPGPLRSGYFGDKRPVYETAVATLVARHALGPDEGYAARALEVVQRAKARDLLDSLGDLPAQARPLTVGEIGSRLGEDVLVELFVASGRLHRWIVRADVVRWRDLGPAPPFVVAAERVHQALAAGESPAPADLERLGQGLLSGLEEPLDGAAGLRLAADGAFFYLPFEALSLSGLAVAESLAAMPLSYLPSASALPAARPAGRRGGVRMLLVGDPLRDDTGPDVASRRALFDRFDLPPLAAANAELERLPALFGGAMERLSGAAATEGALRLAVARGPRVVHLATHTVIDGRSRRGSAVLLSPGGGDDGLLFTDEIAALELETDLVVLASCATALGGARDGRALASLAGSFLAAGAPAVVATLWDVGDRATLAFMEQLYHYLARGLVPEEAVRAAKLAMQRDPAWRSPHLWSPYVVVGRGVRVAEPRSGMRWLIVTLLWGLGAVGLWVAARVRGRR